MQASHRLLLTGTLIQNDSSELMAVLHFLLPRVFTEDKLEEVSRVL
jgi:SNF2 family DNA or RNA helicase